MELQTFLILTLALYLLGYCVLECLKLKPAYLPTVVEYVPPIIAPKPGWYLKEERRPKPKKEPPLNVYEGGIYMYVNNRFIPVNAADRTIDIGRHSFPNRHYYSETQLDQICAQKYAEWKNLQRGL